MAEWLAASPKEREGLGSNLAYAYKSITTTTFVDWGDLSAYKFEGPNKKTVQDLWYKMQFKKNSILIN